MKRQGERIDKKALYFIFKICYIMAVKRLFILRWNNGGDRSRVSETCICYLKVLVGQKFRSNFIGWF